MVTDVSFAYLALYPFLFGVHAKFAEFSPRSCILYDSLIHILLMWLAFLALRYIFELPWNVSSFGTILFVFVVAVGRPDKLGIALALASALALRVLAGRGPASWWEES